MSNVSKILLVIIFLIILAELIQHFRRYRIKRKRFIVRRISSQRAQERLRDAHFQLYSWRERNPFHQNSDPEYQRLVEICLLAFRSTLKYRDKITDRDKKEIDRLEGMLMFRKKEFTG